MSCPEFITRDEFERRLKECCKPVTPTPPPDLSGYCTKSECADIRRIAQNALSIADRALNEIKQHTGKPVPGAHQWNGNVNVDVSLASSGGRSLKLFTRVDVAGKSGNDSETISITNLKGDKGDRGEKGVKGDKGDRGINGTNGINGKEGKPGVNGKDGVTKTVYVPDTQTKKRIEDIEKVNKECCDLIVNKINNVDSKLNGIIVTLAGMVAAIIAAIKSIKLEINPELNIRLDSLIGKVELALKPIFNIVNNIDLTIKGIELTIKGIDFSIKGIDINITGIKVILDSLFKLVNNFKLDVDFEPVFKVTNKLEIKLDLLLKLVNNLKLDIDFEPILKISNNLSLKLDSLLNLVNNLNFDIDFEPVLNINRQINNKIDSLLKLVNNFNPELEIDFSPVLNISNRIEAKLNAQLQVVNQLQITLQAVLSFLVTMQNQLIAAFKAELNVALQTITNLRAYLQTQINILINNNQEIKDAVKFQIAAPIGDCVLIEEAEVNGETVPEHKEYQIIETKTYNTIGNALQGIYERFNSVQEDVCESEQKQSETDCLVLLPDPGLFYEAGKFLTFSWVLESNPKVIVYQTHTQLRNTIPALQVTPDPNIDYWGIYFDDIYRIMGKQFATYWAKDNNLTPLIKGWFLSEEEAIRFFTRMLSLTTSEPTTSNNPRFRNVRQDAMQIEHTGEKLILKRVCYAEKDANTDKLKKLHGWGNPNL